MFIRNILLACLNYDIRRITSLAVVQNCWLWQIWGKMVKDHMPTRKHSISKCDGYLRSFLYFQGRLNLSSHITTLSHTDTIIYIIRSALALTLNYTSVCMKCKSMTKKKTGLLCSSCSLGQQYFYLTFNIRYFHMQTLELDQGRACKCLTWDFILENQSTSLTGKEAPQKLTQQTTRGRLSVCFSSLF